MVAGRQGSGRDPAGTMVPEMPDAKLLTIYECAYNVPTGNTPPKLNPA